MNICVLGAGSLGSAIGGMLALSGNDVTLVNRNAAFCEKVNTNGLKIQTGDLVQSVKIRAAQTADELETVDLVIVLVKSKDTEGAINSARHIIGRDTVVISLQNGLGQEEILAAVVGRDRVIAGKTYVGGLMTSPGVVTVGAAGKETIIGELDGAVTPRIKAIADVFNKAELKTTVSRDIMAAMWDKLLVNVATGAVSAITGLDYGNLYSLPEVEETAVTVVEEAMSVAYANGIAITTSDPRDAWNKASAGLPFGFKASMLQSLEKGSVTEIDFVNGAVVSAGEKVGIPTPLNRALVALVKGVERALNPLPTPVAMNSANRGATRAYLEHVAVNVSDINWHREFFRDVLGMSMTMHHGDTALPDQLWTLGGVQLVSRPGYEPSTSNLNHFGMAVEDPAAAISRARTHGIQSDPRGENWLALPDGIVLELLPAESIRITNALKLDPRAKGT